MGPIGNSFHIKLFENGVRHGVLYVSISPRSRIFRRAVSSQLTKWGKKIFFLRRKLLQPGSRTPLEQPSPNFELRWSSLNLPLQKWCSGEELLRSSRTTLEQIAPWEILLLREIQG
jgi:hypothetical protein